MDALKEKLAACFAAVFPNRRAEEILSATRESIEEWDSLAAISLLTLIQQEFHTDIDLFELEELGSFQLLLDHLGKKIETGEQRGG